MSRDAAARARDLLERIRSTPMRRGAVSKTARRVKANISRVLGEQGVPGTLAHRIAFQLVIKIDLDDLRDHDTLSAMARLLCDDIVRLTGGIGLTARRIAKVLPKLSAAQIEEFLAELERADRRIARTVLDAAIDAADPIGTGRRYLGEYRLVARQIKSVEPTIARTLANATFKAGMPLGKALEHVERLLTLIAGQQDNPDVARLLARSGLTPASPHRPRD